jgi:2-keto-3-deoxy-L-fuconate dehydrogenase
MERLSLKGKAAIVTGAASGIGRAIAELFAESGARVHLLDFDAARVQHCAGAICKNGNTAIPYHCDVSNISHTESTISSINRSDPVTILVNNAGIAHVGNVESTSEDDIDRLFRVNVKGYYSCIKACIPQMKERRCGVIVNIASIAGSVGLANRFAYSMSKGAVLAMTYSVAKDYLACNIRCNSISPARVHTPFVDGFVRAHYPGQEHEMLDKLAHSQPIGRMATSEEIAFLALYLCSDSASFVTGSNYVIDGGAVSLSIE